MLLALLVLVSQNIVMDVKGAKTLLLIQWLKPALLNVRRAGIKTEEVGKITELI